MKRVLQCKLICFSLLAGALLLACHTSRPGGNGLKEEPPVQITSTEQADKLLDRLESNIWQLGMLTHDVVDNADAIINIEENTGAIIRVVEENSDLLTSNQKERFQKLREEYKNQTGF